MHKLFLVFILSLNFLTVFAKFNRPDPKRDWDWTRPHTLNLYQYVKNDPINSWDPTGFTEKEVEAILRAIDSSLNDMAQQSANDSGHERASFIYMSKDAKISAPPSIKTSGAKGGKLKPQSGLGKIKGIAHTHNVQLTSIENSPPGGLDIAAIAGKNEGTVNIVQADTQRFAAEVADPVKGKAFLKAIGGSKEVKNRYNKIMGEYRKTDAGKQATAQQVQVFAALQIANEAGVTLYQTNIGRDQTDVVEVKLREPVLEKEAK